MRYLSGMIQNFIGIDIVGTCQLHAWDAHRAASVEGGRHAHTSTQNPLSLPNLASLAHLLYLLRILQAGAADADRKEK